MELIVTVDGKDPVNKFPDKCNTSKYGNSSRHEGIVPVRCRLGSVYVAKRLLEEDDEEEDDDDDDVVVAE